MSDISPEAQALIDRLSRMDLANPRHDRTAIERAIRVHLGERTKPIVWAMDLKLADILLAPRVSEEAGSRSQFRAGLLALLVIILASVPLGFILVFPAMWVAGLKDGDTISTPQLILFLSSLFAIGFLFIVGVILSARARDKRTSKCIHTTLETLGEHFLSPVATIRDFVYARVEVAAPLTFAFDEALSEIQRADRSLLVKWRRKLGARRTWPMTDAFEAGMLSYLAGSRDVVCLLRPGLSIGNGLLHASNGPAVIWPSGEVNHFWRGVPVPDWIVEEPDRITVGAIQSEQNQEVRRCMVEIYGRSRYLLDSGARLVHEDAFGRLWETDGADGERWRLVEVEDGTPGPDGTRRIYTLDVTDAAEMLGWPIETARAAVAATYGLREEEYCPDVRT